MAGPTDPAAPELPPVYEADLTKGMEHMRPYVSVAVPPKTASKPSVSARAKTPEQEPSTYGVPASALPSTKATPSDPSDPTSTATPTTTITTDAANPHHRADPAKFGSRYLNEDDDIFAFNAWDDVPLTASFSRFAESQYAFQRTHPVPPFDAARFNAAPHKWWDKFYAHNSANFFKDRQWLFKEFPRLGAVCAADAGPVTVLEVGCGAGNTAFPLLRACDNERLRLVCCDFSAKAVEVVRGSEMFEPARMSAVVWDVAAAAAVGEGRGDGDAGAAGDVCLPPSVEAGSVDVVILVFVFSALAPAQWAQALRNLYAVLRPGGEILFRDYGRGDLAQVRFKKGRWLEENFYVRGDGTRVYFFEQDQLRDIFSGRLAVNGKEDSDGESANAARVPAFEVLDLKVDRRMLVNRQRRLKMYRCWMQGHFRRPDHEAVSESTVATVGIT